MKVLSLADLLRYKSFYCKEDHEAISCLGEHDTSSPLRRPVSEFKEGVETLVYSPVKCKDLFDNAGSCKNDSNCVFCHTSTELSFHPLNYLNAECTSIHGDNLRCPNYHNEEEKVHGESLRKKLKEELDIGVIDKVVIENVTESIEKGDCDDYNNNAEPMDLDKEDNNSKEETKDKSTSDSSVESFIERSHSPQSSINNSKKEDNESKEVDQVTKFNKIKILSKEEMDNFLSVTNEYLKVNDIKLCNEAADEMGFFFHRNISTIQKELNGDDITILNENLLLIYTNVKKSIITPTKATRIFNVSTKFTILFLINIHCYKFFFFFFFFLLKKRLFLDLLY